MTLFSGIKLGFYFAVDENNNDDNDDNGRDDPDDNDLTILWIGYD